MLSTWRTASCASRSESTGSDRWDRRSRRRGTVLCRYRQGWLTRCASGNWSAPRRTTANSIWCSHGNVINRGFMPAMVRAGPIAPTRRRSTRTAGESWWQIHRAARPATFLRVVVHQPRRSRWNGFIAQVRAGSPRPCVHHHDARHVWPPVPDRRRFARGGCRRACAAGLDQAENKRPVFVAFHVACKSRRDAATAQKARKMLGIGVSSVLQPQKQKNPRFPGGLNGSEAQI